MRVPPISSTTSSGRIPAAAPGPSGSACTTAAPRTSSGIWSLLRSCRVIGPASMPRVPPSHLLGAVAADGGGSMGLDEAHPPARSPPKKTTAAKHPPRNRFMRSTSRPNSGKGPTSWGQVYVLHYGRDPAPTHYYGSVGSDGLAGRDSIAGAE